MTERGRAAVSRDATTIEIGPSALSWIDGALSVRIDETTAPIPSRLRGTVRITPQVEANHTFPLDAAARHTWRPIAPRARAQIDFALPAIRWSGDGYFDMNHGVEPLEEGFRRWDWARAHTTDNTLLFYDVDRRDGGADALALKVRNDGSYEALDPPPRRVLPRTAWGLESQLRADAGAASSRRTLEDTPFYARSALKAQIFGEHLGLMHESLSLDRFRTPIVQAMLPFRMPRVLW